MKRVEITLCAIAVAAAGTAAAVAATKTTPQDLYKHCLKIVAFGSSSTEGVGASTKAMSYPSQVAEQLRDMLPKGQSVTMVNRGIGGEDSHVMMKRLKTDVIDRHPGLVIWQTGSNDPMTQNPLPRFEAETREGIKMMRAAGIEVVLMEPQWAPHLDKVPNAGAYTEAVERIGREMNVAVIYRTQIMKDWERERVMMRDEMMSKDKLHMSDRGYRALAHCVAKQVMATEAYKKLPVPDASVKPSTPAATHL